MGKNLNTFEGESYAQAYEKLEGLIEIFESDYSLEISELNVMIDDILNDFYIITGDYPKYVYLLRLANILLRDELRDKDRLKSSKKEYPILSETQIKFREKREKPLDNGKLDFFKARNEYNLGSAFKRRTQEIDE